MIPQKEIAIAQYNYPLPDERIARYPMAERDQCQLLVYKQGEIVGDRFCNLGSYLPSNTLLIRNNTRVIRARLQMQKPTGGHVEVMCLEPATPANYELSLASYATCSWHCLVGNARRWKEGFIELKFPLPQQEQTLILQAERAEGDIIRFSWNIEAYTFGEVLSLLGTLPIPPYLRRETEERDYQEYQTVYAQHEGSVAAPTAGLHFTPELFSRLEQAGILSQEVTLHVGAGTFMPVKSESIGGHTMHHELCIVSRDLIALLARGERHPIVAVGTTSVRTLESLYLLAVHHINEIGDPNRLPEITQWEAYENSSSYTTPEAMQRLLEVMDRLRLSEVTFSTALLIAPGYTYRVVEGMITNFHQPQSTLLLMISAFVGDVWREIYQYALDRDYRFLSYGDGSLLLP